MKFYKKVLISLLFAIALELSWFQLSSWIIRLDRNSPKDLSISFDELELINWQDARDGFVSESDPIICIDTEPMHLYTLDFLIETEPLIDECTFFYTDENGVIQSEQIDGSMGRYHIKHNKDIGAILRLDPGEEAGVLLTDMELVINSTQLHVSFSRIIAIVLIYVCGSQLFRIQRMPDYTRYIQKRNNDE